MQRPLIHATTLICLLAARSVSWAQCPDGTPPPCAGRAAVVARAPAKEPAASDRARRFLVLPFRNVTRQPEQEWLVEGSTTMLGETLGRWQGISIVSDELLYPSLKRAGIAPGTVIDQPRMRRLAEETGGWTAVLGEVLATGGRIRITARAVDIPTNKELVRVASEVPAGGDVRAAFDSVGLRLLRSAGIDSPGAELAEATTHNLDAYRAYLSGLAHSRRSEVQPALADFQQAVKLDSTFALAWFRLANIALSAEPAAILNPSSKAAQYSARAVSLSSKLPPRHRQLVLGSDATYRAQFGEARTIFEALVAADSNDVDALGALASLETFDPVLVTVPGGQRPRQQPNRAARLAKRIAELDPSRPAMFGMLAQIYAAAGIPGSTPVIGVDRAPTSFPDLLQIVSQREHVRIYSTILRDSLMYFPAESLAAMPKDSLLAWRKRARAVSLAWAQRWVSVAPDVAAARQMMAELYALDGDYPSALAAVAKAESLGVSAPTWSPPARRLLFQGKAGNLAVATRLADSLTAAGFFSNPNNALVNGDAMAWAFALNIAAGRVARAATLFDQSTAVRRAMNAAAPSPEYVALLVLLGNEDPADEPGIPRSVRVREVDTILAHAKEFSSADRLGPWMPMLTMVLADAADEKTPRVGGVLKAAEALAAAGQPGLAFQLASNAVASDSTLEVAAAAYPWYRAGAEAFNGPRSATLKRFHPGTATIGADRAVFEWKVDDAEPFTRNRAETPPGRPEYRWEITIEGAGRYHRLTAAVPPKFANNPPVSGTLSEILIPSTSRMVTTGAIAAGGAYRDTTALQSVALRTEIAPGVLRLVVTDKATLDAWRSARPASARFRFQPCVRAVGSVKSTECVDQAVSISYP